MNISDSILISGYNGNYWKSMKLKNELFIFNKEQWYKVISKWQDIFWAEKISDELPHLRIGEWRSYGLSTHKMEGCQIPISPIGKKCSKHVVTQYNWKGSRNSLAVHLAFNKNRQRQFYFYFYSC